MIRPLKLPGDFRVGVDLILHGFQNERVDKKEVAVDSLRSLRYLWPLIRIGSLFSPGLRDYYRGYIWEEDSRPVGLVVFGRVDKERWEIDIIVVLPEFRRRGIARSLMQAAIGFIRKQGGKVAFLDADGSSEAAGILYQQIGFEQVFTSIEYNQEKDLTQSWPLPDGYEFLILKPSDWRTQYDIEWRVTPERVTRYEPVVESRYRAPGAVRFFQFLLWKFSGQKVSQIAVRSSNGKIVAWGRYLARMRPGGVNYASLRIDPKHESLAICLESHLIKLIQQISPGRRIMFSVPDWQESLIQASLTIGSTERSRYHRMGLFL